MSIIQSRVKGFESVASLCLLGVIVLIGVGVLVKQSDYEMSQFGMDTIVEVLSENNSNIKEKMVFDSLSATGFENLLETEVYDSQTLYEKINGKAPIYLESGFRELVTQRFVIKKDQKLWAELFVYDMGSAKNAYSVYSRQKRTDVKILSGIGFAYESVNALFCAYGQYYIEFIGSSEAKELLEGMREIVQKIRANKAVADVETGVMKLFSSERLIPDSIKLYLNNTFGFEGLTDVFTGQYQIGNDIVTAFLSKRISAEEARKVFQKYHGFLLDNSGVDIPVTDPKMKIVDFYGTIEIVGATGRYVFGVHEAESRQVAEELAGMLSERLNE